MRITKKIVADQIAAYLQGKVPVEKLVYWAEQQVMESEFQTPTVRDAVARLGLADVRAFGLTWEDCQRLLGELGFAAHVEIATAK